VGDGVVPALDPDANDRRTIRVHGPIASLPFGAGHGCFTKSMDEAFFHSLSLRNA
jgi:hypothetical protein